MSSLAIRPPRRADLPGLRHIYQEAFSRRSQGRDIPGVATFSDALVATLDTYLIGLACLSPAAAFDDLDGLLGCLTPATRRLLEPSTAVLLDQAPPLVFLAPKGVAPVRGRGDRVVNAIAVTPGYRRCGVGRQLAQALVARADREGVPQLFVHSIEGTGSRELFEGLGFIPLLHLARHYPDGAGMTFLFREGNNRKPSPRLTPWRGAG